MRTGQIVAQLRCGRTRRRTFDPEHLASMIPLSHSRGRHGGQNCAAQGREQARRPALPRHRRGRSAGRATPTPGNVHGRHSRLPSLAAADLMRSVRALWPRSLLRRWLTKRTRPSLAPLTSGRTLFSRQGVTIAKPGSGGSSRLRTSPSLRGSPSIVSHPDAAASSSVAVPAIISLSVERARL